MHVPSLYHLAPVLAGLLPLAASFVIPQSSLDQSPFSSSAETVRIQPVDDASAVAASAESRLQIPTRYESTVLARRLLTMSTTGVLSTIFPPDTSSAASPPSTVANTPVGLIDYVADCEAFGDPTIIALNLATTFKNAAPEADGEGRIRNISLSLDWWTQYRDLRLHSSSSPSSSSSSSSSSFEVPSTNPDPLKTTTSASSSSPFDLGLFSPASLPRLTLIGHLEPISHHSLIVSRIPACFLAKHPDASWWLPNSPGAAHSGRWVRLVVEEAYWVGGFGDRAYIGWLDAQEYRGVSLKEIAEARLPGEKEM